MTKQEFAELLARGYEVRGVEFKGPFPKSDKPRFAKVTRAILGMSNRRDGGLVIIGVEDTGNQLNPLGLNDTDLSTWKYDDIASTLSEYADPYVNFKLEIFKYDNRNFAIINVLEFDDIPTLCKKTYNYIDERTKRTVTVLRDGACYVRTHRKTETTEIPTQTEMRELLEIATEKRLRKFVTTTSRAGVYLSATAPLTDQDLFDNQLGDLK